jgi:hypothetical protein
MPSFDAKPSLGFGMMKLVLVVSVTYYELQGKYEEVLALSREFAADRVVRVDILFGRRSRSPRRC